MNETADDKARRSIGARRNPASAEAILEAAEAILSEEGPAGFSIEAVARRARAGKPTIYRWWPSRMILLLDVYHRQKGLPALADTGDLGEDVFLFLQKLLQRWQDGPIGQIFRMIIAEAQSNPETARALADYLRNRRCDIAQLFARAAERQATPSPINPELAAELVSAFAWSRLLTDRLEIPEAELRIAARIIADGFLRPTLPDSETA